MFKMAAILDFDQCLSSHIIFKTNIYQYAKFHAVWYTISMTSLLYGTKARPVAAIFKMAAILDFFTWHYFQYFSEYQTLQLFFFSLHMAPICIGFLCDVCALGTFLHKTYCTWHLFAPSEMEILHLAPFSIA